MLENGVRCTELVRSRESPVGKSRVITRRGPCARQIRGEAYGYCPAIRHVNGTMRFCPVTRRLPLYRNDKQAHVAQTKVSLGGSSRSVNYVDPGYLRNARGILSYHYSLSLIICLWLVSTKPI